MSNDASGRDTDLQFDTAVLSGNAIGALTCHVCQRTVHSEYYDVLGSPACAECRDTVQALSEPPRGAGPLLKAGAFGLAAGIVGSVIYYAVIAITNFEIGIVAILIGYMVGYAVRKGANGRGGRRFQVLAVVLTYVAVALAYTPIAVESAGKDSGSATVAASTDPPPQDVSLLKAVAIVMGVIAALPVLVIIGGLPSSVISALIIFFGMQQAWKMTGAPALAITGPYRVGAPSSSAAAV